MIHDSFDNSTTKKSGHESRRIVDMKQKKCVLVHKNSLAPCQLVPSQRRATCCDVSFQTKQSECLVIVELTSHTYTHLRETLIQRVSTAELCH